MADKVNEDTVETPESAETVDDTEQAEIAWVEDLMADFKPEDAIEKAEAEEEGDVPPDEETEQEEETETAVEVDGIDPEAIGEADYAKKVAIKNEDGSTSYKTVRQLLDEGMLKADHTRKTMELARQRENLKQDQAILDLLDTDKHARDYLNKRIEDIKAGKATDGGLNIDIPENVLEQLPWLKDILNKVNEHDVEISKSRTTQERTQVDQAVGKIDSIMTAAQTAIEKAVGSKLEPAVFRARVGKTINDSLSDSVPEDKRVSVIGQLILADKDYFVGKALASYQQEIEVAKEKAIDAAKQERAQKAQKTQSLKGGGATVPKDAGDLKVVIGKDGRPDLDGFLEKAFTGKGGR